MSLTINKYFKETKWTVQDTDTAKYYGYLKDIAEIHKRTVSGNTATSYRMDFFGLLTRYDVHPALHKFNLYINGFSCSAKYSGQREILLCNDYNIRKFLNSTIK